MKAIAYVRVSTADQANGLSLESQQRAISEEVARRGWELAETITEARSGKDLQSRPELTAALKQLDFAGEGSALVVARMDRLGRSMLDICAILDRAHKQGWTLLCLSPMVDMSDPFGECMAHMAGAFAQLERRLISARQRESVAARRAAGTYVGPQSKVTPEMTERVLHLRGEGMSLRAIAEQLMLEGFAPPSGDGRWYAKTVSRVLEYAARG